MLCDVLYELPFCWPSLFDPPLLEFSELFRHDLLLIVGPGWARSSLFELFHSSTPLTSDGRSWFPALVSLSGAEPNEPLYTPGLMINSATVGIIKGANVSLTIWKVFVTS